MFTPEVNNAFCFILVLANNKIEAK